MIALCGSAKNACKAISIVTALVLVLVALAPAAVAADQPQPQVTFTFGGFDTLQAGVEGQVTVTAQVYDNGAIADTTPLRYRATLTKDNSPVANLTIKYPEPGDELTNPSTWHAFTTDASGVAYFGPASGFTLQQLPDLKRAGVTTPFRATLDAGSYTLKVELVDWTDSNNPKVLGQPGTQSFTVAAPQPTVAVTLPAKLVVGDDFTEFTGTATNPSNGASYDRVRFDFELSGITGLSASNLAAEYLDSKDNTWKPLPLRDEGGVIKGYYGPLTGFPMPAPYSATTQFRVKVLPNAPTGTLTVTSKLVAVDAQGTVTATLAQDQDQVEVAQPQAPQITASGLDTFAEGVEKAFSVSTTPGDYAGTLVRAEFEVARQGAQLKGNEVTLLYEETAQQGNPYLPLPLTADASGVLKGSYGPAEGFPLAQATSNFKATFAEGTAAMYTVTVRLVRVSDNVTLASAQFAVTVAAPPMPAQSTYKLTQTGLAASYTAGSLVDVTGKSQSEINAAVESAIAGLTPIRVTLATDVLGQAGYEAVRILPVGAGDHIQLWAKDTANNWYDINKVGWGPLTGFALPAQYSATTDVYLLADQAGDYTLTTTLVDVKNNNAVIAQATETVHVVAPQAPTVALTLPQSLTLGVTGQVTAAASNPQDGLAYSSVRFRITVDAPAAFTSADQVTAVAAAGDPAAGQSVTFTVDQNGDLVGWWGPASGFPLPKGYQAQTTFDVTVKAGAPTGAYTVTVELVDLANNAVLASDQRTVEVTPAIISFWFRGVPSQSFVDSEHNRVTALVPPGTNLNNLVPEFLLSKGVTLSYGGKEYQPNEHGQIAIESGVNFTNTNPQTFIVKAPDGTTQEWTVTVLQIWMSVSPNWVIGDTNFERTFTLRLEGVDLAFSENLNREHVILEADFYRLSVKEVSRISDHEAKVYLSGPVRLEDMDGYGIIRVLAGGLKSGNVWVPEIHVPVRVFPNQPLFNVSGSLNREEGIRATVSVAPKDWIPGAAVVVFQLMKNDNEPVSIVALEKEGWSPFQTETFIAHFNVTGYEYAVRVFVLDEFTSNPEYAPVSAAEPLTLR